MIKRISLLIFLCWSIGLSAQDFSKYEKQWLFQRGDTLPFRVLLPEGYDPAKTYPLLVFLHGRGESGTDNEKQLVHGAKMFLTDSFRTQYPAIVVFPQCPSDDYWSNVQMVATGNKYGKREFYFLPEETPTPVMLSLMGLVRNLLVRYPVNKTQVYAMGLSMGGMGTYELVRRMPDVFTAAIPICGGAPPETAPSLKKVKWWIFHGAKDDVVLPEYSQRMVEALQKEKASVKFTLYPNANHNSWDPAFAEPGIMQWLFAQKRGR